MKFFKKSLLAFGMLLLGLFFYGGLEFFETKKLVQTTLKNELSSAFYIRHFGKIDDAKTPTKFNQASKKTLNELKQAQSDFNQLTLYTPFARAVRNDYNQAIDKFEKTLQKSKSNPSPKLSELKKDIDKAEQLLLNSRERLFNLSERYLLSGQLKMG